MPTIEILGLVAATITTSAFVPQVFKTWREKSTKDISLTMYTVMFIGVSLWFVYGVLIQSVPVTLANGVTAVLIFALILLKLRYK